MVFTVSLRMKECVRIFEIRMKLACLLAERNNARAANKQGSFIRSSDIHSYAFIHS